MKIFIYATIAILLVIIWACTGQSKSDDHFRRESLLATDIKNIEKFKSSSGYEKWVAFMNIYPLFLKYDKNGKPTGLDSETKVFDDVTRKDLIAILGSPDSIEDGGYSYIYFLGISKINNDDGCIIASFSDTSRYLDQILVGGIGEDSRYEVFFNHIIDSLASLNSYKEH